MQLKYRVFFVVLGSVVAALLVEEAIAAFLSVGFTYAENPTLEFRQRIRGLDKDELLMAWARVVLLIPLVETVVLVKMIRLRGHVGAFRFAAVNVGMYVVWVMAILLIFPPAVGFVIRDAPPSMQLPWLHLFGAVTAPLIIGAVGLAPRSLRGLKGTKDGTEREQGQA
ncbi:MAG TPA: hypothetical protein VE958_11470 [Bryobacteraceae bacterium]|nr:hypothetical protein [Bryobacteraceae bacterium]